MEKIFKKPRHKLRQSFKKDLFAFSTSSSTSDSSINTIPEDNSNTDDEYYPTNSIDTLLAPFLLSSQSLIPLTRYTPHRYLASWLHMQVMVRIFPNHTTTLRTALYMSRLRHPNLELLLGASLPKSNPNSGLLVTEYINGPSITTLLKSSSKPLSSTQAFSISLDICRALVYLHTTINAPHGAVCTNTVLIDSTRGDRAVLLLATDTDCNRPDLEDFHIDVYCMAVLIVKLFAKVNQVDINDKKAVDFVDLIPKDLRSIIWNALQEQYVNHISMEKLCQTVIHANENNKPS